ncbi:MAG: alanine racemase [Deltaproteobacteria bacterium]|nr:alanine racemase [Deltaproteobacteria bacterium]
MSFSLNTARIDLDAVAHNLGQVRKVVGPGVRIMGVVKADAYGHGLIPVAEVLERSGADALGVMDLHEAVILRDKGLNLSVFILAGFEAGSSDEIVRRGLIPFIYDLDLARQLNQTAKKYGKKARVHLKVDTGMNRLGAPLDQVEGFLEAVRGMDHLEVSGLASHFSEAGIKNSDYTLRQLVRFKEVIETARVKGYNLTTNNTANSAAVLSLPESHFDMVRPGLMLYLASKIDLKPVMTLISKVIQVKKIGPDSPVSYGRKWVSDRETIIATLPIGYAHGYNRRLFKDGYVLIRGQRAPVRGVICMNLTMVDVTHIPGARVGDEAVLLGSQGDETISGPDLANKLGTISYEVFCTFGGLNHRQYVLDKNNNKKGEKE